MVSTRSRRYGADLNPQKRSSEKRGRKGESNQIRYQGLAEGTPAETV